MNQIHALPIYKFKLVFEVQENMELPKFKGSMFKGAFGWTFREIVCVTKMNDCSECTLKEQCSYFKIFETEMPQNEVFFLKGVKKSPHPFIISPTDNCKGTYYKKGATLSVTLTIFAEFIQLLPYFIFTFIEIGKRGIGVGRKRIAVKKVHFLESDGNSKSVLTADDKLILPSTPTFLIEPPKIDPNAPGTIKLTFSTPLRIQNEGYVIDVKRKITPEILIRAIYRRYYAIYSIYGKIPSEELKIPTNNLVNFTITENKLKFEEIERYSSRQRTKMKFGGFLGSITIAGNLEHIYPVIQVVEKLNLGKNTAFGYGEFNIDDV